MYELLHDSFIEILILTLQRFSYRMVFFGPHQTEFQIKHETFVGQCQKLYLFSGPLDIPMARLVFIDLSGHMHIYNICIPEQIVLP